MLSLRMSRILVNPLYVCMPKYNALIFSLYIVVIIPLIPALLVSPNITLVKDGCMMPFFATSNTSRTGRHFLDFNGPNAPRIR